MKLNIDPSELLVLHDVIRDHINARSQKEPGTSVSASSPELVQLKQVHGRLRSIILSSLSEKSNPMHDYNLWRASQEKKIKDIMKDQLDRRATDKDDDETYTVEAGDLEDVDETYPAQHSGKANVHQSKR